MTVPFGGYGGGTNPSSQPIVVQGVAVPSSNQQQQSQSSYYPSAPPQQQHQQYYNQQPPQPQQNVYYAAQPHQSQQQGAVPVPVPVQPQQQYGASTATPTAAAAGTSLGDNFNGMKGENQPSKYNDVAFAIAFLLHFFVMVCIAFVYGGNVVNNGNNGGGGGVSGGLVGCTIITGLFSMGLSSLALGFMMQFPEALIKCGLIFSIGLSFTIAIMGLLSGAILLCVMGFVSAVLGCCYAYFVWSRIPFAAANMKTALTAVKANMGMTLVSYGFLAVAFGWYILWAVGASGAMMVWGQGGLFFFLVSYYWTQQVIQNTVHVTTAGVVGTWWFAPDEASSFCSTAITSSLQRATTYSFGSICMGSLLVALVQALRHLLHHAREQDDCQVLVCIIDCILSCIQGIIEELNRWAYTYIGLYGYTYLDAGRNVMTLFQNKGWSSIISEDLVDNVLLLVSVAIGLSSGLIGLALAAMDKNMFAAFDGGNGGGAMYGFVIGFLVGFVISSTLMSVVGAAVNTVIVCFAESPVEFSQNHPQLSQEMREAWKQAWPMECGNM